jgi:hypothetical protein
MYTPIENIDAVEQVKMKFHLIEEEETIEIEAVES